VTPSVTEASKVPAPTPTVERSHIDSARVNADAARTTPGAATPTPPAETRKATVPVPIESVSSRVEWPGFRGPGRDGVVHGVQINTDWTASPPVPLWHRHIGPGWSSFAVSGDLLYTQEQRGEDEIVACYRVGTGEPVWMHRDKVRFWESNGGAGPRATPTLSNGRVYAFGATGRLNVLSAANGAAIWARDVASDANKKVPMWGFSSSPLVIGDLVVVAASGKLVAYDIASGKPRWFGPDRPGSYSSPHRVTIDGVEQILLLTAAGATSVALSDGAVLWEHSWPEGTTIVQPAMTPDGDVLINSLTSTGGLGIRRLNVTHGSGGWTVTERWTSTGLKPYFNDFVVHKGHAFGFDGSILACIDLQDGKRKWKGGRYGDGQLVLLPEQDLLLVVSEEGELALVKATPDQFTEVARFKAVEGKTWNHPVVVRDFLLVRNGEEMAAFRLSLQGR
jgi:outer membrane protein assembly factor BamB